MGKKIDLRDKIYDIPNFPQKGIVFRDLTPLLLDPVYFKEAIEQMLEKIKGMKIDLVCGIDSRGFLFGPVLADRLNVGFVPIRKIDKILPRKTAEKIYKLEYGENGVKMHADAVRKGQNVLLVDDLVATGGTARASVELIESLGGKVIALLFLNELCYLQPRQKLKGYKVISLIKFRK